MFKCFSTFVVVQSLSGIQLFATPWTAAHQAPLSSSISQSLLKFMSLSQWCHLTISSFTATCLCIVNWETFRNHFSPVWWSSVDRLINRRVAFYRITLFNIVKEGRERKWETFQLFCGGSQIRWRSLRERHGYPERRPQHFLIRGKGCTHTPGPPFPFPLWASS